MKLINYFINFRIRKFFIKLFKKKCLKTKIKEKSAVFISHPDFCDNIYPIYKELEKRGYKCLWVLFYKKSKPIAKKMKAKYICDKKSMRNMFLLSKYHYVFYSHSKPYMYEKDGQKIFNCWHGSPFKVYHGVLLDNRLDNYYFVPSGEGSKKIYLKYYGEQLCEKRCIPYRHFRTDYFLSDFQVDEKKKIIEYFKLNDYKKTVLVCLTWIRDKQKKENISNLLGFPLKGEDFIELNNCLKKEKTLMIIKPHPAQKLNNNIQLSNIKVVPSFELTKNTLQLYALIGLSDILITDYSSILFDYALLDKPVGHIIHHWDYFKNNKNEEFIYDDPKDLMYGTEIDSLEKLTEFIKAPKQNDEEKRNRINAEYNTDQFLRESSTIRFIENEL